MNLYSKISFLLMCLSMAISVWAYTSVSHQSPEEPVRLIMGQSAGKIIFTHNIHAADYGIDCSACHHLLTDEGGFSCRPCHNNTDQSDSDITYKNAMHGLCIGCHIDQGGPETCNTCHFSPRNKPL